MISRQAGQAQEASGSLSSLKFEPYPYLRMCLRAGGALVVEPGMLFPNSSDIKTGENPHLYSSSLPASSFSMSAAGVHCLPDIKLMQLLCC